MVVCSACISLAVLLTGCGGAPNTQQDPGEPALNSTEQSIDVSTLLTREEAAEFLKTEVGEALVTLPEMSPAQPYLLFFESTDASKFIQVGVLPDSAPLAEIGQTAEQIYTSTRDDIVENEVPVDGVGDEAFWGTLGLHIHQGPYYVTIGVGNTNNPANLELAKEIAGVVLPRLP
jgi:hypothetical protein